MWFLPSEDRKIRGLDQSRCSTDARAEAHTHRPNVPTPLTMSVWAAGELVPCTANQNVNVTTNNMQDVLGINEG